MKYGMELEFFVSKKGKLVFPGDIGLPCDGLPILAELRTQPGPDAYMVVGEMVALLAATKYKLQKSGHAMQLVPSMKVSPELHGEIFRRGDIRKSQDKTQNLYGLRRPQIPFTITAGIHIHFSGYATKTRVSKCKECGHEEFAEHYHQIDIPSIVRALDGAFESIIKKSGRIPGEYELKPAYGFEYRSLPNNTTLWDIARVVMGKEVLK